MKLKHVFVQAIACSLICISCESHEQKADEAFKNYKAETIVEIDSSVIFKDSINRLLKSITVKKTVKKEDCNKYKNELEEKVYANNLAIVHLKEQHQSGSKVFRKILRLEEINNQFMVQLKDFEIANKTNRKDFEENINKELNDVNLNIKEYELLKSK